MHFPSHCWPWPPFCLYFFFYGLPAHYFCSFFCRTIHLFYKYQAFAFLTTCKNSPQFVVCLLILLKICFDIQIFKILSKFNNLVPIWFVSLVLFLESTSSIQNIYMCVYIYNSFIHIYICNYFFIFLEGLYNFSFYIRIFNLSGGDVNLLCEVGTSFFSKLLVIGPIIENFIFYLTALKSQLYHILKFYVYFFLLLDFVIFFINLSVLAFVAPRLSQLIFLL